MLATSIHLLTLALQPSTAPKTGGPMRRGDEASLMRQRSHGTCAKSPSLSLRWGVVREEADQICCFNRHYAEPSGAYERNLIYLNEAKRGREIVYYDSITGKPLFVAPRGRTIDAFLEESSHHGWPSFRDEEVVWEHVRVLPDGETVSTDGSHLGHNIPDAKGSRYCINLCSVAGQPPPRRMSADDVRAALRSSL